MKKFENGLKLICPRTLGPFDRIMPELYWKFFHFFDDWDRRQKAKTSLFFYSFLSIQMLPYIIFLCKFVQLVDRYFSLVLRGRPVTTTTATWNCYKELGISNVIGNLHKNAWHGNWGQYNIRHDLINVV